VASVSILAACQQQAPAPPKPATDAKPAAVVPPTSAPTQQAPAVVPPTTAPAAAAAPATAPTAQPAAKASIKRGGELRIMQVNDFVSMDPIHASGPTARPVYDSLFAWRPNAQGAYKVEPMLAKSWELGTDKLVVKLQENVKFHDGSDLNADAVVWNIARMVQNPKSFARNICRRSTRRSRPRRWTR
jgi:ABC-type transport system substrate-binding protein